MSGRLDPPLLDALDDLSRALQLMLEAGLSAGRYRGRPAGPGYEFRDFRAYATGDDARHLVWRRYARDRQLVVSVHAGELNPHVHLLLDRSGSMNAPGEPGHKDRFARQLFLSLAYLWMRAGARVQLATFDARGWEEPGGGPIRGLGELLEPIPQWLEAQIPAGPTDFSPLEGYAEAHRHAPGIVVVVSDFAGPPGRFSRRMLELSSDFQSGSPDSSGAYIDPSTHRPQKASSREIDRTGAEHASTSDTRDQTGRNADQAVAGLDRLIDAGHRLWCVRVVAPEEQDLPRRIRLVDAEDPGLERWIALDSDNRKRYQAAVAAHEALLLAYSEDVGGTFTVAVSSESVLAPLDRLIELLREGGR